MSNITGTSTRVVPPVASTTSRFPTELQVEYTDCATLAHNSPKCFVEPWAVRRPFESFAKRFAMRLPDRGCKSDPHTPTMLARGSGQF